MGIASPCRFGERCADLPNASPSRAGGPLARSKPHSVVVGEGVALLPPLYTTPGHFRVLGLCGGLNCREPGDSTFCRWSSSGKLRREVAYVNEPLSNSPNRRPPVAVLSLAYRIQSSSTADMEEESASARRRNPTFLKTLWAVRLSRNISAEMLLSCSSRAIWTVRRSNSIPRPCFWH
jgi:hypothetical protein